jgi:hypothetical protein
VGQDSNPDKTPVRIGVLTHSAVAAGCGASYY